MRQLIPRFIFDQYSAGNKEGNFAAVGMFVDISGFSAMTDALMVFGRHGAEVLADVMRKVFAPLIQTTFEQGGFVCAQAGDSFTALFPLVEDEEISLRRSLSAARAIQQQVADHPTQVTHFGEFPISVKVGLALGEAVWGVIDAQNSHQAVYYFSGSAVDGCAAAEDFARAGDTILMAEYYDRLQSWVEVESFGEYSRLLQVNDDPHEPLDIPPRTEDLERASRFVPRELLTQKRSGEFRQITYVFISLPTVRTKEQLAPFMQSVFALQSQYGGLLELQFGDKGAHMLLIWGAPLAHENDIQRAVNFAFDLQAQTVIPIICGITHRVAHVGFIGSDLAEQYAAFGRGVNLAARFMTTAPRGEIWLDEYVAEHVDDLFELEDLGEMSFKGFATPQKVFLLIERSDMREMAYTGSLVGREAELERLHHFINPIFYGEFAGMVVVWGEPGIGKSRLVHDFLDHMETQVDQRFQVCLAQSDEILRTSMNPFKYWLRDYFDLSEGQSAARNKRSFNRVLDDLIAASQESPYLAAELDRTRSFLGALVGLTWPDSLYEQLDAEGRYENTMIALISLLQAESLRSPLIFFLEDIHWLDADSKLFLPRLMRALTADERYHYPVAILSTARYEGAGLPVENLSFQEMHLAELDQQALAQLAEAHLGKPAAPALLDLLLKRAEGNPFFAEQILYYLLDEGLLVDSGGYWSPDIRQDALLPADVHTMLVARLDRLVKEVREVVQMAAIIGREFEIQILSRMLQGDQALIEKIAAAEEAAIWAALSEMIYIFRHALLREAAYRMQLHARRQELHALAVEALENIYADRLQTQYGELAYHAEQAGLIDKARDYLLLAGKEAQAAYQNALAIEYYRRALDLTPDSDYSTRYELYMAREKIHGLLGKQESRRQDLDELKELVDALGDAHKKGDFLRRLADFEYDLGNYDNASEYAHKVIEVATSVGGQECVGQAHNLLALILSRQGQYEQAILQANMGLELARKVGDRRIEGILLNNLGMNAADRRDINAARDYFLQAQGLFQDMGDIRLEAMPLNNLGMVAGFIGDYAAAQDYYLQALEIGRKIGKRSGEGIALGNLGWISGMLGEYEQARAYVEQNLRIAREIGDRIGEVYSLINLSLFTGALDDNERALDSAEGALAIAIQVGDRSAEAWAFTYLGNCHLQTGKLEAAKSAYNKALEIRYELEQPSLATETIAGLARVSLAEGDLAAALDNLQPVLEYLSEGNSLDGTDQPMLVYHTAFRVLERAGDPRAEQVLESAYAYLSALAENIRDKTARQAFLQDIKIHQEIMSAWIQRSPQ